MYLNTHDQWLKIRENVASALGTIFPIAGKKGILSLVSVEIKDVDNSISKQREALLRDGSFTCPVYGVFRLTDTTGRRLDEQKIKILDLPVTTQRGTYIVEGKDYNVFNQMRLRPGVYTSYSEDADTAISRFNLGKGLGFRILLDPETGVFNVVFDATKIKSGGQAKIPLYSMLRILAMKDDVIKQAWGQKLFDANAAKADIMSDAKRLQELCVYESKRTANPLSDLHEYFNSTQLNEQTTKVTLGEGFAKVSAPALLAASTKMIKVYNHQDPGDDMDSLMFKEILAAEDHIMLRITKGFKESGVGAKIRFRIDAGQTEIKKILPSGFLSKLVETFFTTSSLASPQTELNPVEIIETNSKITAMGEGGIQSEHGIPMSARNLHSSHFGYLDPVRTTESMRVGIDLRMSRGTEIKDRNLYRVFKDKTGKMVRLKPTDTYDKIIGFPNQDGDATVHAMRNGEMLEIPRNKVDYWLEDASDMFTYTSNLVPFTHNTQGNRVTMASRMITQAVPITGREAPLVQVKDKNGKSVEQNMALDYLLAKAPEDGVVKDITDTYIQVNKTKVDIYHNFPMNQKTFLHMHPIVKVGDNVKKGQPLVDTNFTKGNALALGTNLRVGYVPYFARTHEDAVVISESTAKRLTSEHMYTKSLELSPEIVVDKHRFVSMFPLKINAGQMAKLDEEGVVKKGQILERGDYAVTALAKRDMTNSDQILMKMHASLANPYKDVSVVWDHDRPGLVVDVVRQGALIKIVFKTEDETRVGDKLTGKVLPA